METKATYAGIVRHVDLSVDAQSKIVKTTVSSCVTIVALEDGRELQVIEVACGDILLPNRYSVQKGESVILPK